MISFFTHEILLFAEQSTQCAQRVTNLVCGELHLHSVHNLFNQLVGQVDTHQFFHNLYRLGVELFEQSRILLNLFYDLIDFCFDIYFISSQFSDVFSIAHLGYLCQ